MYIYMELYSYYNEMTNKLARNSNKILITLEWNQFARPELLISILLDHDTWTLFLWNEAKDVPFH